MDLEMIRDSFPPHSLLFTLAIFLSEHRKKRVLETLIVERDHSARCSNTANDALQEHTCRSRIQVSKSRTHKRRHANNKQRHLGNISFHLTALSCSLTTLDKVKLMRSTRRHTTVM